MTKRKTMVRVIAITTAEAFDLVHEALGDAAAFVECIDIRRLRREYGPAVAGEVLRQLVSGRLQHHARAASRRTR
jgi:hypothetical protein